MEVDGYPAATFPASSTLELRVSIRPPWYRPRSNAYGRSGRSAVGTSSARLQEQRLLVRRVAAGSGDPDPVRLLGGEDRRGVVGSGSDAVPGSASGCGSGGTIGSGAARISSVRMSGSGACAWRGRRPRRRRPPRLGGSSSRTITANATRLMQKRFSMLLFFICFASIQSICAGSGAEPELLARKSQLPATFDCNFPIGSIYNTG